MNDAAEPSIALAPNGHETVEFLPRGQALHRAELREGQGASPRSATHRLAHGGPVPGLALVHLPQLLYDSLDLANAHLLPPLERSEAGAPPA